MVFAFRYRERKGLTVEQYEREPWEEIWLAQAIWSADSLRDSLESGRQAGRGNNNGGHTQL